MFLRLVADSFGRRPRRKLLTGAALALGMAVVTAAFSVSLDVGDQGGCNPIGVTSHIDGSDIVMDLSSLGRAAQEVPR